MRELVLIGGRCQALAIVGLLILTAGCATGIKLSLGEDLSALPHQSPDADQVLTLQSNVNCQFFVDSQPLAKGKRVKVVVTRQGHQLVCKPDEYRSKEEYVQPPYDSNPLIGFTFLMEDKLSGDELMVQREMVSSDKGDNGSEDVVGGATDCRMKRGEPVAVLPFTVSGADSKMGSIGSALAESVTVDLVASQLVKVIERSRIESVVKEMKLGLTGLVDERTAQSLGRVVGATYIVIGSVDPVGGSLQIVSRVLKVESGQNLIAVRASGAKTESLALGRRVGAGIVRQLKACVDKGSVPRS